MRDLKVIPEALRAFLPSKALKDPAIIRSIAGRAASNVGWTLVSDVIVRLVFFAATIYLARLLGMAEFGVFSMCQATAMFIWIFVDLGTSMHGAREIARNKESAGAVAGTLLVLRLSAGLSVYLLYSLGLLLFMEGSAARFSLILAGLFFVSNSINAAWILQGLEEFKYKVISNLVSSAGFLILVGLLVHSPQDTPAAVAAWALSFALTGLAQIYFVRRRLGLIFRPDYRLSAHYGHLKDSIFYLLTGAQEAARQYAPIFVLGVYWGMKELGEFSAAYKLVFNVSALGGIYAMAVYPILSSLYVSNRGYFHYCRRASFALMLSLGIPTASAIFIYANDIMNLLYGGEYSGSGPVLQAAALWIPLFFARSAEGISLVAAGLNRYYNAAAFLGLLTVFAAGYILIPGHGAAGAGLALVISEFVILLGTLACGRLKYNHDRGPAAQDIAGYGNDPAI